jgi:hypothetical protein
MEKRMVGKNMDSKVIGDVDLSAERGYFTLSGFGGSAR